MSKKLLEAFAKKFGPPPKTFTFGDGIDWSSPLEETYLYVELPFWLMMPSGPVKVKWSGVTFAIEICPPWMEVFVGEITRSRRSCLHQGPLRSDYKPSEAIAEQLNQQQLPMMVRPSRTVLRVQTRAHTSAFRELGDNDPPRARAEQGAYWASLCEAHLPVVNELIQRYRLATYDYFAYEISAWDAPIWHIKHAGQGFATVLLPYKAWDVRPCIVEDGDKPEDPLKVRSFQWTTPAEMNSASSGDATPGEFELLDARSLMERGDYTGAVRRTVTAIEAVLEWALLRELEKKHTPAVAAERLRRTQNNFPGRLAQWRKLARPDIGQALFDEFASTRKIRHEIVHRGLRLVHSERGRAERAVDTGRWLYNKIEQRPESTARREKSIAQKSLGRVSMTPRFPAQVTADGITIGPMAWPDQ